MKKIMGREFRPMTQTDYEGFAGAGENAMIYEDDEIVLIYDPEEGAIFEINADGEETVWKGGASR